MSTFWKTSLSKVTQNKILIRGYRVDDLMEHCSFGDVIYLTFTGELPAGNEGRMLETIVVSSTDHFFLAPSVDSTRFVASGGVPLQASVAAGLISLGDHHGGAGRTMRPTAPGGFRGGSHGTIDRRGPQDPEAAHTWLWPSPSRPRPPHREAGGESAGVEPARRTPQVGGGDCRRAGKTSERGRRDIGSHLRPGHWVAVREGVLRHIEVGRALRPPRRGNNPGTSLPGHQPG